MSRGLLTNGRRDIEIKGQKSYRNSTKGGVTTVKALDFLSRGIYNYVSLKSIFDNIVEPARR